MGIIRLLDWFKSMPSSAADALDPAPYENEYSPVATEADIVGCFRLLLGRIPEQKEWHGHRLSVGIDLSQLVTKFVSSDEFQRRGLTRVSLGDTEHEVLDLEGMQLCISSADGVCGLLRTAKEYEPGVTAVILRVLAEGMTFIDIGANIGYFSVLAAKRVGNQGKVFAVEPYPYNIKILHTNIELNSLNNVEILPFALAEKKGFLNYDDCAGNSGTVTQIDADFAIRLNSTMVYCVRLDDVIDADVAVDLIKMDIEGAEYLALKGMNRVIREQRPIIISEISNSFLKRISGVSLGHYLEALLAESDYEISLIKNAEVIVDCNRDIIKVLDIYAANASECMDVVVYPAGKRHRIHS
ncbi:FkbM family methyltransferase [Pseudomonas sp.]|uniref:FkbM family methyltransferase n=1 Tax=Pseudomonas sp. TaxID=306 RepID=UPI002610C9A7|nr:FkbM family methyltransferase [Pseudomonas sp.]